MSGLQAATASGQRRWWALGALALSVLVVGLDLFVLTLALPTLPIVAPPIGAADVDIDEARGRMPVRAAMLRHTQLFNLTGHPAISLPVPTAGLPVGLQLVGHRGATADLLAIAAAAERVLGV